MIPTIPWKQNDINKLTSDIEESYSSKGMDVATQGFSILPCQSSHHASYQLPQRSRVTKIKTDPVSNGKKNVCRFKISNPKMVVPGQEKYEHLKSTQVCSP